MAWIYLAESEESASRLNPGSKRSRTAKKTHLRGTSSCQECGAEKSNRLQYGMISPRLKLIISPDWTSSSEDSRVRISRRQALELAWQESEVDYSSKSCASWKKHARPLSSLKTYPQFELADFLKLSAHLPIFGMTVGGRVYLPQALELHTSDGAGSYLPTPTASSAGTNGKSKCPETGKWINARPSLSTMASQNLWPTPRANDSLKRGEFDVTNPRNGLPAAVKRWPTPVATDGKAGFGQGDTTRKSPRLQTVIGGQLNPTWVEWLMGFPPGWTALDALAMQSFPRKQGKPSKSCQESKGSHDQAS